MEKLLDRFIRNLTIYTAAITLVSMAVAYLAEGLLTRYWAILLLLIAGITLTLVTMLFKASQVKLSRFTNTFMIGSMVKILLLLVVMLAYAYKNPADIIRFSLTLLLYYILYLIFEIIWLLKLRQSDDHQLK